MKKSLFQRGIFYNVRSWEEKSVSKGLRADGLVSKSGLKIALEIVAQTRPS